MRAKNTRSLALSEEVYYKPYFYFLPLSFLEFRNKMANSAAANDDFNEKLARFSNTAGLSPNMIRDRECKGKLGLPESHVSVSTLRTKFS